MKHANIALFVPHAGCPNECSFCNQKTISGFTKELTVDDVKKACDIARKSPDLDCENSEIAFFGGSFTAIDREYMLTLLKSAKEYIDSGFFKGIRISTRPDAIDDEVLDILKEYGVTSIELGAQSMDDNVLKINRRGHTAEDIIKASNLIKKRGFSLGLQMMTGLMGDSDEKCLITAEKIIKLKPQTVRIYPTIVLENTFLAECLKNGTYKSQTLNEAVNICSKLLLMFQENDIKVIRLGLHSGGNVEDGYISGAYHPAFRDLCEGEIYMSKMLLALSQCDKKKQYLIEVPKKSLSKAKGQGKRNEKALINFGFQCKIKGNDFMSDYQIAIKENKDDFKSIGDAGI
ncbi:MAG: radical SAM protein [Oscillospiraceae bacterium]